MLLALSVFTSCASQQTDELPELPTSEASLLDESEVSTPVADDTAVFADLNAQPADSESTAAFGDGAEAMTVSETASGDSPFYNPVGGESLGRVAYTLYGDRNQTASLLGKNPDLTGVKSLTTEQKVYFDFAQVRPMPTFLTKDLIDRYPGELASKLEENNSLGKESVTLAKGETLQELSQRLYGTTRYWTEIYLLNRSAIGNYDKVQAGVSLVVLQRAPVAIGSVTTEPRPVAESAMPKSTETEMAPTSPVMPSDPIPETPDYSASAAPAEVTHAPAPAVEPMEAMPDPQKSPAASFMDLSNSANVRRIVYIALILLIGCVAFYMTRTPKKKNFDMLDVTSDTTAARAKLKGSDSHHHQDIG